MRKRTFADAFFALAISILAASSSISVSFGQEESIFQNFTFRGWSLTGQSEIYRKDGLFGYIDGGAEIFLQYGFVDLSVNRYRSSAKTNPERVITLEIYRMQSPADAFGIFSVRREGNEKISPRIKAAHWIAPTQASLVKGLYFINISSQDGMEDELEAFAAAVSQKINASPELPPQLSWLPPEGLIQESERYIKGELAAANESPLLDRKFWGFEEGTRAVSAKYQPAKAKLIVIQFNQDRGSLSEKVKEVFAEYLDDVSGGEGSAKGKNASGSYFIFRQNGQKGFLVCGEPNLDSAWLLIKKAEAIAKM